MSLFGYIAKLDQKFSWSFLGFLLAVILGGVTIYTEFIKKNSPDLNFEIVSNANVLDVHESIGSLDISYKGSSLNRSNQSLRILVLRVVNSGDQAILPSFYDPDDPVGFRVFRGQIVEKPRLLEAGSPYVRDHLLIYQTKPGAVLFSKIILEPGEFFVVKLLLLCNNTEEPTIFPVGKVAGIKRISLKHLDKVERGRSLPAAIFAGSFWVQIIRAIAYPIALLLSLIPAIVIAALLTEKVSTKRRRDATKAFKLYAAPRLNEADEFFFDSFILLGYPELFEIRSFLNDPLRLRSAAGTAFRHRSLEEKVSPLSRLETSGRDRRLIRRLVEQKIVEVRESEAHVNAARKEILDDFIGFLERKGFRSNPGMQRIE